MKQTILIKYQFIDYTQLILLIIDEQKKQKEKFLKQLFLVNLNLFFFQLLTLKRILKHFSHVLRKLNFHRKQKFYFSYFNYNRKILIRIL